MPDPASSPVIPLLHTSLPASSPESTFQLAVQLFELQLFELQLFELQVFELQVFWGSLPSLAEAALLSVAMSLDTRLSAEMRPWYRSSLSSLSEVGFQG